MMDYVQRAIEAIRKLPPEATGISLWIFPEQDFEAWRAMPDIPDCKTYADYLTITAAIQAEAERMGKQARRVTLTVAAVVSELTCHGLANNGQNRSKIISLLGAQK